MRFIRSSPLSPLFFFFSFLLCSALSQSQVSQVTGVSAVGCGPDLGFGGCGGGSLWVGDPIWVLGVATAWESGWG